MPALLKALVAYQTVDLFAASTGTPYSLQLTLVRLPHSLAKFWLTTCWIWVGIGLSLPAFAYCAIAPGSARIAMSGGVPPLTFAPSTVASSPPAAAVYWPLAPVALSKALMTAWKA